MLCTGGGGFGVDMIRIETDREKEEYLKFRETNSGSQQNHRWNHDDDEKDEQQLPVLERRRKK